MRLVDFETAKMLNDIGYSGEYKMNYYVKDIIVDVTKEKTKDQLKPNDIVVGNGYWCTYLVKIGERVMFHKGELTSFKSKDTIPAPEIFSAWKWLWEVIGVKIIPNSECGDLETCILSVIKSSLQSSTVSFD